MGYFSARVKICFLKMNNLKYIKLKQKNEPPKGTLFSVTCNYPGHPEVDSSLWKHFPGLNMPRPVEDSA